MIRPGGLLLVVPHVFCEECNNCDMTAAPSFRLANHNDSSRWFALLLVVPHVYAVPISVLSDL